MAAEIDKHHRGSFDLYLQSSNWNEQKKKGDIYIHIYKREKRNKKIKLSVRSEQNPGYQSAVTIPLLR